MRTGLFSFLKLAAPAQEKLDLHFSAPGDGKKWAVFRRELKSKGFLKAVEGDDRSDDKLKLFAQMVHFHKTGKGPTFPITGDSGKRYTVKYHPSIERFTCSCPDWTIKRSTVGEDCKHIKKLKSQSQMVKEASFALRQIAAAGRMANIKRQTESNDEQSWHASQVNKIHRNIAQERKLKRLG